MTKIIPLIERLTPNEANLIMETSRSAAATEKYMWLHGIVMQAELKNRNGRLYPLTEMVNAVAQLNEQIRANNGIVGELDHPETLSINYKNASHIITELKMDGNNVIGKCKLLNTPPGLVAQEIYKNGIRPAVSSRGAGSVTSEGIVEGFNLITIDIVATNSAPGANPSAVYESTQGRKVLTLAEQMQQDPAAQKYFKKEIVKLIKQMFTK